MHTLSIISLLLFIAISAILIGSVFVITPVLAQVGIYPDLTLSVENEFGQPIYLQVIFHPPIPTQASYSRIPVPVGAGRYNIPISVPVKANTQETVEICPVRFANCDQTSLTLEPGSNTINIRIDQDGNVAIIRQIKLPHLPPQNNLIHNNGIERALP